MKWMMKRFYMAVMAVVLLAAAGLLYEYLFIESRIEADVRTHVSQERDRLAGIFMERLNIQAQVIRDAATFAPVLSDTEVLRAYMDRLLRDNSLFNNLFLGTADKQFIDAPGTVMPAGYDPTVRPWYLKAKAHGTLVFTNVYESAYTGDIVLAIAMPVMDEDGKVSGVMAGDIRIRKILDLFSGISGQEGIYSMLIDDNTKKVIAHPDYARTDPSGKSGLIGLAELAPDLTIGERMAVVKTTVGGLLGYLSYRPVPGTVFLLASFIPETAARAWNRPFQTSILITLLALAAIPAALIFTMRRYVIKPVIQLGRDLQAIPIEPEMGYRIPVHGKDVFSGLKAIINGLLEKLQQYFEQVKRDKAALMDHVALRDVMLTISQSVSSTHDIEAVYKTILTNSVKAVKNAALGTIMVREGGNFRTVAHMGYDAVNIEGFTLPVSSSFLYRMTEGRMDAISRIGRVDDLGVFMPIITSFGREVYIKSTITAPLYINNELFGMINLDAIQEDAFTQEDEKTMAFIKANVEIALANSLMQLENLRLARYDSLSGLYNRQYFEELFQLSREHALRYGEKMFLAILDVNRFKHINDTFGHLAGDDVLRYFARQLTLLVRKSDLVSRYGGDEFICLFFNADLEALTRRIDQFAAELKNNPLLLDGMPFACTFSYGIAVFGEDGTNLNELFKRADERMYAAKARYKDMA